MRKLKNKFWTNEDEMIKEIEKHGYEVVYVDYEIIEVVTEDDETMIYELVRANNTMAIKL